MIGGIEYLSERTFSKDYRQKLAKEGVALPDGSYPIPDKGALRRAIQAIGRSGRKGSDEYNRVKRHCIKRALLLDAIDLLPEEWKKEKSLGQSSFDENFKMEEDYFISDSDFSDFIEHFGVKGMRWGVVKEENQAKATADAEKRAKREASAKKYDERAAVAQREIDKLDKIVPKNQYEQSMLKAQKMGFLLEKKQAEKDAQAKRDGKLTDKQRKIVKGAVITAAVLAAYGTYTAVQNGELHRNITQGKMKFLNRGPVPWKTKEILSSKDLDADGIMKHVVQDINPGYGKLGTKVNCRRATFAYEMRRRGYDVAATRTTNGRGQDGTGLYNALNPTLKEKQFARSGRFGIGLKLFKDQRGGVAEKEGSFTHFVSSMEGLAKKAIRPGGKDMFEDIGKLHPDGARGELGLVWAGGGGHSVAWEKIKGTVHVFDTQSGKRLSSGDEFDAYYNKLGSFVGMASVSRLDDLPLNTNFLMRWLKDA